MKMYRFLLFVVAGFSGFTAVAQDVCNEKFKEFKATVISADYKLANSMLGTLRKDCAKANEGIYQYADRVMLYNIEVARTDADKAKAIDAALELYAAQYKNFPAGDAEIRKVLLQSRFLKPSDAELFKVLDAAFVKNSALFTDPAAIELYFNLYFAKVKANEAGFGQDAFIKRFGEISAQVSSLSDNISKKRGELIAKKEDGAKLDAEQELYLKETQGTEKVLEAVSDNLAKQAATVLNCTTLENYYNPLFEKNKESVAWVQGMVNALNASKCEKNGLYAQGLEIIHQAKPSYESAYGLARVYQKKGDNASAVKYYNQAADKQPNRGRKAEVYMTVAGLYRNGNKALAKEFALKAAETDVKSGRPYLFIAEMYMTVSAKDCEGLSDFDRKALVWSAIDMLKKAEATEPKFKPTVASLEEEYSKSIPTKKEAKAAKRSKGDEIKYGCWINETVKLPKLK